MMTTVELRDSVAFNKLARVVLRLIIYVLLRSWSSPSTDTTLTMHSTIRCWISSDTVLLTSITSYFEWVFLWFKCVYNGYWLLRFRNLIISHTHYKHRSTYCWTANTASLINAAEITSDNLAETMVCPLACFGLRLLEYVCFSREVRHGLWGRKVFIAAWKNCPRRPSSMRTIRYTAFSDVVNAEGSFIEKQGVCSSLKGRLMFVMSVIDSNVCEGVFRLRLTLSVTFEPYTSLIKWLKIN